MECSTVSEISVVQPQERRRTGGGTIQLPPVVPEGLSVSSSHSRLEHLIKRNMLD